MEPVLFEDDVKYDLWLKIIIAGAVVVLVLLAGMFYVDAYLKDILPDEPAQDSKAGMLFMVATLVFVLMVYSAFLPKKFIILRDRLRIRSKLFSYSIPFSNVESFFRAKGLPLGYYLSSATSLKNQVEFVRKKGRRVRISPVRMDLFMEALERAFEEWKIYQPH